MNEEKEVEGKLIAPGTLVLVAIFFVFFIIVTLLNLLWLSRLWPVS